jgi:hypothetical protein
MSTKLESAQSIAAMHSGYDPDLLEVIRITGPDEETADEPIKLLEINAATVSAGIMPVFFGPSNRVPFASIIVEITPDEFQRIRSNQLTLPDGWRLGETLFSRHGGKSLA